MKNTSEGANFDMKVEMTNRNRNYMMLLIAAVPFSNQLINIKDINLPYVQYIPFIGMVLLFIFCREMFDKREPFQLIFILFTCVYTISPFIGLTVFNYSSVQNLVYIILFLIFIAAIRGTISFVNQANYKKVILAMFVGNSLILVYNMLTNLNQINSQNYSWLTTGIREARGNIGFSHPNTAGMFFFLELILVFYLYKLKYINKTVLFLSILVFSVFLLATGSRTAVYSTVLFLIINMYLYMASKIHVKLQLSILFGILLPFLTMFLLRFNYSSFF
ncbi:hypothetical protein [Paenibacillus sp. CCS19]|uniref:hypothetical protein n=1 Tax=Paenibacillus sp. CCS19 TaxID=3158387 RepID=UPI00295EE54F|nr:hypothetical protein [Paenibacillus cellulosilyticus]